MGIDENSLPFIGEYRYSVDTKGRFSVPAKFREILSREHSPELVLKKGTDRCLFLLPISTWRIHRARLDRNRVQTTPKGRFFARSYMRGGDLQQPDSQGRIQLNKDLRDHAQITDSVVVFGNDRVIEVWAPEVFDHYMAGGEHPGFSFDDEFEKYFGSEEDGQGQEQSGHGRETD